MWDDEFLVGRRAAGTVYECVGRMGGLDRLAGDVYGRFKIAVTLASLGRCVIAHWTMDHD